MLASVPFLTAQGGSQFFALGPKTTKKTTGGNGLAVVGLETDPTFSTHSRECGLEESKLNQSLYSAQNAYQENDTSCNSFQSGVIGFTASLPQGGGPFGAHSFQLRWVMLPWFHWTQSFQWSVFDSQKSRSFGMGTKISYVLKEHTRLPLSLYVGAQAGQNRVGGKKGPELLYGMLGWTLDYFITKELSMGPEMGGNFRLKPKGEDEMFLFTSALSLTFFVDPY